MTNENFVIGVDKVYRLAGNDWYAVEQDDDKVMLIDTDCEVAGEELRTSWSDTKSDNGQNILDYTNTLADKYFSAIKYAIIQRDVNCKNEKGEGQGELKGSYMWPLSDDECEENETVNFAIHRNIDDDWILTRTFSGLYGSDGVYYAYYAYNSSGKLCDCKYITYNFAVAPAFYLNKSAIDYITEAGEIILKPAPELVTNE